MFEPGARQERLEPGFRSAETLQAELVRLSEAFGYAQPPFQVEWLSASARRNGLSYHFDSEGVVRIHGVLADSIVPDEVIQYELSYWLAAGKAGASWRGVESELKQAGVWPSAQRAIRWRRTIWPSFYLESHPLRSK